MWAGHAGSDTSPEAGVTTVANGIEGHVLREGKVEAVPFAGWLELLRFLQTALWTSKQEHPMTTNPDPARNPMDVVGRP
jgi:hypothetical protein